MKCTHRLQAPNGAVLAVIYLSKASAFVRVKLTGAKKSVTSWSPSLHDDLLAGRWYGPFLFLYGADLMDFIPQDATVTFYA